MATTYSFQQINDTLGTVRIVTHLGIEKIIAAYKEPDQQFRLSGTAITDLEVKPGYIIGIWNSFLEVQVPGQTLKVDFEAGEIYQLGETIFVYEHYPINAEAIGAKWIASRNFIKEANIVFINVDILKEGQVKKQLRIDTYFGKSRLMDVES